PRPVQRQTPIGGAAAKAMEALVHVAGIVHLHGIWETNLLRAPILCRRCGGPSCVRCCRTRDRWSMQQSAWKKKVALKLGFRGMLAGAAFIQALNADEIELMRPLGLKPPSMMIPNGIFLNEVEDCGAVVPGLPDRPYVLFLSRL